MYKDPERESTLTEIEVFNRNTRHLGLPSVDADKPNISQPGIQNFLIWAEDLPIVMDLVEPQPELINRAKEMFEARKKRFLKDKGLDGLPGDNPDVVTALGTVTFSFESCFTEYTSGRDIKPLTSCKVLREGIAPKTAKGALVEALRAGSITPDLIEKIVSSAVKTALQAVAPNHQQNNQIKR